MGCCFSSPQGPNSPYPGGAPQSASARAINTPPQPTSSSTDEAISPSSALPHRRQRQSQHTQPLEQHLNKPLRRHVWTSRHRTWTLSSLEREREDFFDTRTSNRTEIWQTIRAALEVLRAPDDNDQEGGIATAQTILDAAGITVPTGNLATSAYDSFGNFYQIPEWVVSNPTNMVDDGGLGAQHDSKQNVSVDEGSEDDDDEEELERRREEKGKAVVDVRHQVSIKARLSENAQDISVGIDKKDTIKVLARKILVESGLPSTKRIRIAYMGKILKENVSLSDQGYEEGHVVNALVFNR